MERTVQISIIIPVYNVKEYLPMCVESVVKNTRHRVEILLIDDGSNDESGLMCDQYALLYDNIRVIHKENGGLGSARNVGMDNAIGEYILYLDSDDYLDILAIDDFYDEATEKNLDILLFGATTFFEDEVSAKMMPKHNYVRKTRIGEVCTGLEYIVEEERKNQYITSVCLRMYRREFLLKGEYKFNEIIIHEDVDYSFFTLLDANRVEALDRNCYYRRYRQGSIITSAQLNRKFMGYEYAWTQFLKYIEDESVDDKKRSATIKHSDTCLQSILSTYSKMNSDERKRINSKLRGIIKAAKKYKTEYKIITVAGLYFPNICSLYLKLKPSIPMVKRIIKLVYSEPEFVLKLAKIAAPSKGSRIILLGTPIHGNSGDHLIALAEEQFLRVNYPEYTLIDCTMNFCIIFEKFIKKHVSKTDLLFIPGGGWLGTDWPHNEIYVREKLRAFKDNRIIILPQTVCYVFENEFLEEGKEIYSTHKNLIFCLREMNSWKFVVDKGLVKEEQAILLPDCAMLYQGQEELKNVVEKDVKLCFRSDLEKLMSKEEFEQIREVVLDRYGEYKEFDTVKQTTIRLRKRKDYVKQVLSEVANAKLVITDRLHAMIMCVLMGTPCIAYDNSTHKVSNVYKWIETLNYIHVMKNNDNLTDVIDAVTKKDRMSNVTEFRSLKLEQHYKKLISKIGE